MNPVLSMWKKRILYLWKLYYKFISFQIDGVILIYLFGLIGVMGFYFKEIVLEIIGYMSVGYMAIVPQMVLVLSLISGNLNGYLKLADQVFLSPLNIDGKRFLKYSHALNRCMHILIWSLIWTLLYFYYRINFGSTVNIYLVVLVCGAILKVAILNLKFAIWNKQGRWKRRIYNSIFYFIVSSCIAWSLPMLTKGYIPREKMLIYFTSVIIILTISQLIKKDALIDWEKLINEETNKRVRNFAFLLGQSSKEKKSSRRKTMYIFSGRKILSFNPKGALLLLYFRTLQRGNGNMTLLLQMYFGILAATMFGDRLVNSSAIITTELFTIISLILVAYIVGDFLSSIWINLKEYIWFQIYPYSLKEKIGAIELGPTVVLIIFLILIYIPLSLLSGWILHPILDFIGVIILASIIIKIHGYLVIAKLKI